MSTRAALLVRAAGPLALLLAAPALARAQTPAAAAITACYVPTSGTVYRVDPTGATLGLARACLSSAHQLFTWNQVGPAGPPGEKGDKGDKGDPGVGGTLPVFNTDFYDLSGPTGPASGFVARGTINTGSDAVPGGAGARLVWYPRRQAFRAGGVNGTQWDRDNIGQSSFAGGGDTQASGVGSTAFGARTTASGAGATALGIDASAGGRTAVVAGERLTADGDNSVAMGRYASSNGHDGAFVFGDRSTTTQVVQASADNQFTGRFANGYRFALNNAATEGCTISSAARLACTGGVDMSVEVVTRDVSISAGSSAGRWGQTCPAGKYGIAAGIGHRDDNDLAFDVIGSASPRVGSALRTWLFTARKFDNVGERTLRLWVTCVPE